MKLFPRIVEKKSNLISSSSTSLLLCLFNFTYSSNLLRFLIWQHLIGLPWGWPPSRTPSTSHMVFFPALVIILFSSTWWNINSMSTGPTEGSQIQMWSCDQQYQVSRFWPLPLSPPSLSLFLCLFSVFSLSFLCPCSVSLSSSPWAALRATAFFPPTGRIWQDLWVHLLFTSSETCVHF